MKYPTSSIPFRLAPLAAAGLLLLATVPARAAVIEVGLGPNDCTLVDAVTAANTDAAQGSCPAGEGADDIVLPAGAEFVFEQPFLVEHSDADERALPPITSEIRIQGNGATLRRVETAPEFGLIANSGGRLVLEDLTLTGGAVLDGGAVLATGGADTTLLRCKLLDNQARGVGGGIAYISEGISVTVGSGPGDLTLIDSTVRGNLSGGSGGGIAFDGGGTLRIEGSVIEHNNAASGAGGGLVVANFSRADDVATVVIRRSTFSGNRGESQGGGISSEPADSFTMTDSTVVDNESELAGGGLTVAATLNEVHLSRNLIAGNRAPEGQGREIAMINRPVVSGGYNLIGVAGDAGLDLSAFGFQSDFVPVATDITPAQSLDGIVADLADNGGPTATHALADNSPAIDAIPSELCGGDVNALDQRGVARPQGAGCDIGAFEDGLLPTTLDAEAVATVIVRKGLRVTVKASPSATLLDLANGQPLVGQTVKFSAGNRELCEAQTEANGVASCTATLGGLLGNVLNGGYTATFEGTAQFEGSSAQGALLKL